MILHVDMDAFFASIEQAINPRLKGKPLIVGSRNSKLHTVVCAASYEAKAFGITSGMPSHEAFKLCPKLNFVAAEQSKYIWTSRQIFELIKTSGFETCYASIDEFQIEVNDQTDPIILASNLRKQIQGSFNITASIGIAKNCILAKLASKLNKPNGITLLNEENIELILAKTNIRKICGVGEKTAERLTNLNIQTCLDLYQKSPDFLERYLGKYGINLYISLHSSETLTTAQEETKNKSIGHSYTLPKASKTPRFIQAWIRLLAEMVGKRLRENDQVSSTVHLWLNGPEIGNFNSQKTYQETTNDSYELYLKALQILARTGPRMPAIRALGVSCSNLSSINYPPLFKEQKRREDLLKVMDKINDRLGDGSIYPAITAITRKIPIE